MKTIKGNLITLAKEGKFDVIVHGCNCFNTMGSGIAKAIREEWPEVYEADCKLVKGLPTKLGSIMPVRVSEDLVVVNMYTQYNYKLVPYKTVKHVEYGAVRACFMNLFYYITDKQMHNNLPSPCRVGIPLIGAGLAGGDWDVIKAIIEDVTSGYPDVEITIVEFDNK